jgi:hypothetical protein
MILAENVIELTMVVNANREGNCTLFNKSLTQEVQKSEKETSKRIDAKNMARKDWY